MILCRGAAPQGIYTSCKKVSRKGLSVRGYAPISSPVACLLGKITTVSAVESKRHKFSERLAIFVSFGAEPRKIAY